MTFIKDRGFRLKRFFIGRLKSRRTRFYCVGMAKSGTHSVCFMFSRNVLAGHEPQAVRLIEKYFDWREAHVSDKELHEWIVACDRDLALEVDSSWLNVLILNALVSEFADARFVLTIRDCYSWLNSEFRRVQNPIERKQQRIKIRSFLYKRPGEVHLPEEQVLNNAGLHTLDSYLAHWVAHNEKVLATIPDERLLVVRTHEIRQRAYEIADFAGLPRHAICLERTHEYKNPVQRNIIMELDRNFLEKKLNSTVVH